MAVMAWMTENLHCINKAGDFEAPFASGLSAAFYLTTQVLVHIALKWNPLRYDKHFSSAAPDSCCTWWLQIWAICWFSCFGVVSLLPWTTCVTLISIFWLKKGTSHFKPINHRPWEICSFPPECYNTLLLWLQPSAPALLGFSITLTEAYFHNTSSGSAYLSTSRIPTPVLPLREIYFLYIIRCVGKLYGDVISGFSNNTYWEVSLDFFQKESVSWRRSHCLSCTILYILICVRCIIYAAK